MAYLYRKNRSPYWYLVFIDRDQKERHRSTGLRADNPNDTAKAKALRAETRLPAFRTQAEPNVYQRLPDGSAILDG